MPLDDSILGGSVPFDPSVVSANMVNRLSDQPIGTPVDTDIAIDRAARKLLAPRPQPLDAPTSKASDPASSAAPDLSGLGVPLDQASGEIDRSGMPDLSSLGEPVEPVASPTTPPVTPPVTAEAPKHGAVMRGFVTGLLKENPESTAEALEGIAHLAPKDFKDALGGASKDMHTLSKLSPEEYAKKGGSMWDIGGLDDAMTWAGETFGSMLSSSVPSVAGGVIGGVAGGRLAGKTGAVVGATAGATGPSAIMNYGSVYKALKDEKVDPEKAAEYAAWAAVPITMLDVGSLGPIIGRLGGITEVKAQLARSIAKRIAVESAKGAGREGITEGIQDVIQSATVSLASDKPFWTIETAKSAVENMAGGALGGGGMGAISGIKSDKVSAPIPAPAAGPSPGQAGPATGNPAGGAGGGPQPGPQPGPGPQAGPSGPGASPETEEFLKQAKAAPNPDQGIDPSGMSEAEKIAAYAASRASHDDAREADILKTAGFSDEQIGRMSDEARVDAVIRATKTNQENSSTQGAETADGNQSASNGRNEKATAPEDEEYSILRAGGYSDDNIRDMSKAQRASEATYYRDELGLDMADAVKRYPRPQAEPQQEAPQTTDDLYQRAKDLVQQTGNGSTSHLQRKFGLGYTQAASLLDRMQSEGVISGMDDKGGRTVNNAGSGDRTAPIKAQTAADVARAQPIAPKSQAQAEAENYQHAHMDIEALGLTGKSNVSIETGAGQIRKGVDADGNDWEVKLPDDVAYGRIKGTQAADFVKGKDGKPTTKRQNLDIFIGPHPNSPHVFIVDQHHPGGEGKFDEHKILAGFMNPRAALEAYKGSYTDQGGDRIGHVTAMTRDQFEAWRKTDTTKPLKKEPVASTHDEATGQIPLTEAGLKGPVPKVASDSGGAKEAAGNDHAQTDPDDLVTQTGNGTSDSRDGEVLSPARVTTAEPTQDHHDQIEAVLGQDYDRVLPADAARAAEILSENEGMPPQIAFQHAVAANAVEQGYLTEQEAIDAYGNEVTNVLESVSEGTPRGSSDVEQEGTASEQERPGAATETGVVSGGSKTGGTTSGEGGKRNKPDTGRGTTDKPDTSSEEKLKAQGDKNRAENEALTKAALEKVKRLDGESDKDYFARLVHQARRQGGALRRETDAIVNPMVTDHETLTIKVPKGYTAEIKTAKTPLGFVGGASWGKKGDSGGGFPAGAFNVPYDTKEEAIRDVLSDLRKRLDGTDAAAAVDAWQQENYPEKSKIEDAGEKIGGARKDAWIGRGLEDKDLDGMTGAELDKHVTKHNIWKKPDYAQAVEDGVPPLVAALIKRIYDGIAVKPNNGKYGNFAKVEDLRKNYMFALGAVRTLAGLAKTVDDLRSLQDRVGKAIAAAGLDQWDGLATLKSGTSRNSPLWISSKDVSLAQKAVDAGFPNAEPWTRLFQVFSRAKWEKGQVVGHQYTVHRKNGGLIGQPHDTREQAEAAAKSAYDTLGDDRKNGGEEPKRPHLDQVERTGPDYRRGRNVTSEDFIKDFGFHGVEFGNYVASDERQKVVNLAYDALHDLARTLNLPAKAMSLDGTLSVAFGARGKGGRAAAHYESDRTVINMTKLSGAGSLAHEWAHALDHYLGEQASIAPYKGAVQSVSGWRNTPSEPAGHYAYNSFLGRNIRMPKRLREATNRLMHTLFNVEESDDAFEKRMQEGIEAKKSGQQSWIRRVESIKAQIQKGGSRAGLKQAQDQVEIWGNSIKAMERSRDAGKKKVVDSEFLKQATALSGTTGDYWRRPNELLARSFESYVYDKIAAEGFTSQYLVQGVEPNRFGNGFKGNPYPTGDERTAINAAYDRVVRAMAAGEGKHGEATRIQSAEGEPEPIVTVEKVKKQQAQPTAKAEADAVAASSKPKTLADAFEQKFASGHSFSGILEARKFAKESGFSEDAKSVEEAIEFAVVKFARKEIAEAASPKAAYRLMVSLYGQQPRLGTRTSTSVRDQAYSTPVPLGYLAQHLAGVTSETTVSEPTAGNGSLLTAANPEKVLANEINSDRAKNLIDSGFWVSSADASEPNPGFHRDAKVRLKEESGKVDVVLTNPPFGAVRESNASNASKVFDMSDIQPGYQTHEIDHAIALRALTEMKDNGRAVLILGGINKLVSTVEGRSDAYNGKAKRQFFKVLYDNYNVTSHFTVSGDLYERQGAAWPVDVIVIEGRGKSKRPLPAVDVPPIYDSWDSLGGLIDGVRRQETGNARPGVNPAGATADAGPGVDGDGGSDRVDAGSEQPGNEQPSRVRGKRGAADDADAGAAGDQERVSADAGEQPARSGEQPAAERPSHGLSDDFDDIFNDALDAAYGKADAPKPADFGPVPDGWTVEQRGDRFHVTGPNGNEFDKAGIPNDKAAIRRARNKIYDADRYKAPEFFSDDFSPDRDDFEKKYGGIIRGIDKSQQSKSGDTRPTEDVAKSAAENATDAADEAFTALYKLFGGNKTSAGFTFDEDTYKAAKPHFERAATKFKEFMGDTRELVNRMVAHMRDTLKWPREVMANMGPYLKRFISELSEPKAETKSETKTEAPRAKREQKAAVETENQVTYTPQSKAPGLDTLVPVNMRRSISDALADLETRVGPIDTFVAKELKYENAENLEKYFGAEQVDALGLAIDNIKRGKGFIIGDQTGIGKGRVNAAIIRWAIANDRIPVFVTEKPGLYADMYRDLSDIGMDDILPEGPRILATNTGLKLPLDDAGTVKINNGDSKAHALLLSKSTTTNAKTFFKTHDMVFTNYSQMQTVKGEDTARRQFLESVAPNAVMIFDESHNAGGQKTRGGGVSTTNRSGFARKLVQTANGVFYSSATYAKRPDVMDLYSATDMAMAVDDLDHLAEAIQRGGVPMQQVVATMLSEAGQYIRRERSFDGITYNTPLVEVNRDNYDQISNGLSAIQDLSAFVADAAKNLGDKLKAEGQAMGYDGATGEAGASSTSFTAVMHNVISQLLLAMKVEPAAQMAIAALERGEKPVLTVANTMESFLSDYADNLGISPGEEIPADFSDVLQKYLDRTRTVIIKKPFAKKGDKTTIRHYLTDQELGRAGVAAYDRAKAILAGMDLSDLPVSPIDHLKGRLQKAGYKVGEITGRGTIVDYSGPVPILRTRPGSETTTKGRNATRAKFNKPASKGGIDAIIINQAGSTGISMHASKTFEDQSKRHMIIVQPEGNIDTHMQLLGRVNRTGQVVLPEYSQVVANIPAEKRPAAVLAKKMASLNANTTASRSSAVTAKDVPDFINEYGDEVAISYLADNFDMNPRLAFPVKISETGKFDKDDAMRKLTGRIPLLPLKEQDEVYEHLEGEYAALLQQLEAAGENALEAKTIDLKAQTLTRTTVQAERNQSGSPFAAPVVVEKVSIVRPGKPYKPHELMSRISAALGGEEVPAAVNDAATLANMLHQVNDPYSSALGKAAAKAELDERTTALGDFYTYSRPILDEIADPEKRTKEITKFNAVKDRWTLVHELVPIGRRVTLKTVSGNMLGIVINVEQKGEPKNPLALSTWKVTFAVPDATKTMTLPFSRVTEDGKADPESVLDVEVVPMPQWQEKFTDTLDRFERKQTEAREERYIATGNLLAAYDWLDTKGSILNYTDSKGAIRQGILTSRDFDLSEHAIEKGKQLLDPVEIKAWLDANPAKEIDGGIVEVGRESNWSDKYVISTDKSKRKGGVVYLDKPLTDLVGDFYSMSGTMQVTIPPAKLAAALKRLMEVGAKFKVPTLAPKEEKVEEDRMGRIADGGEWSQAAKANRPQIEALLTQLIRSLVGPNVEIEFNDGLIGNEGPVVGWGKVQGDGLRGSYLPISKVITLALHGSADGVASTAFHEAYHDASFRLQTAEEKALMQREISRIRKLVQKEFGYTTDQIDSIADYEIEAIGAEAFKQGRMDGMHIGVRRWYQRFWAAMRRLANGLRGLGFKTFEDIYSDFFSGAYKDRANQEFVPPKEYAAAQEAKRKRMAEESMGAVARGPGGPNSFDNTVGDILGKRVSALLPNALTDRNATEARVQLQDKFIRVKKAEQTAANLVQSYESTYQAESLFYGRTGQRLEQLEKNHIDPLVADINARGLSIDEVNDFLYALHAQERNERIGHQHKPGTQFHDAISDTSIEGASGMSTDEANAILHAIHVAGQRGDYDAINARIRDIINRTRDTLLNTGLITQETYDEWGRQYRFYVPLRGFAEGSEHEESIMRAGNGYDIRGKEAKKAFGRKSEADGPLNYILLQAELAIVRGEKNRVGNTFLRFVQSNADPDRWEVNKPKIVHVIDNKTGLITTMPDNFSDYNDPNVFITKVGGKPYRIRLKGPDGANLARALNNMGTSNVHSLVRMIAVMTRTIAKLATQWNPEFTIPNFVRDIGEAFINLQEQQQRDFIASYAKHILPAVKGAMLAMAGKGANNRYVQAFHEFDRAGGRVRFFGLENADDIKANVDAKMRRLEGGTINNVRDMGERLGTAIELINGGIENGVRLATYMAARDVGLSQADSGHIALNVTVNFTKKGELGGAINALYMFYTAAAGGTARTLQAVQSKYVRRAFYAIAAIGAVTALYGIAAGGDDDDGESYFSKIPPWDRDKNFIIMWPKGMGHDGEYVKIPVSFGLAGVFQALGSHMVAVLYGGEKPGKALMAMVGVVANTFDPTGGDENLVAKAFPTVARPQVHIETNKNWTGKPLYPDNSWDKSKPDSQKAFRSDSAFSKAAAQKVNEWTGGNSYQPGAIDVHPASIDHWLQTITGGVGRFAKGVADTAIGAYRGDEWEATKTPILRRFYGATGTAQSDSAAYYESRNPERATQEQISRARKDMKAGVNVDESSKFVEDNNNAPQANIFKNADKQMGKLRKQEQQINGDADLPADEKKAQIKELRQQMRDIQNEARKQSKELRQGQ